LVAERSTVASESIEEGAEKLDTSSADQIPESYRADARRQAAINRGRSQQLAESATSAQTWLRCREGPCHAPKRGDEGG
jgi:hypothetical protein